jgi:hypothetical protein
VALELLCGSGALFYLENTRNPANTAFSLITTSCRRQVYCNKQAYLPKRHRASTGTGAIIMEWEQWFCPAHYCATESWMVQQSKDVRDFWTITSRFDEATYTVAAIDPVCLHCGSTLCMAVDLGQRRFDGIIQAGPMLDFVRSLR